MIVALGTACLTVGTEQVQLTGLGTVLGTVYALITGAHRAILTLAPLVLLIYSEPASKSAAYRVLPS